MKKLISASLLGLALFACNSKPNSDLSQGSEALAKDTLHYLYTASYSSDIAVPSHPENAQKVLTVWKMFEKNQIDSMRPYWADTVIYHDASGLNFRGPAETLLAIARDDVKSLDSLRFDISTWESAHANDRNEDWVRIWARERRYSPNGKADTFLMQENWLVKDGKIIYFDQYKARTPK
ncbi:MAG TPA: hypothetical protein VMH01_13920 [Puia sp.]|nr:hypothetical protein [Puia sp.]